MTSFNVIYNIIAQDKFSAAGKKFAAMAHRIKSKVGTMNISLDKARRKFKSLDATVGKAGKNMMKFGKSISGKFGIAAAAFVANTLRLFNVQSQAVAKVQALIISTGGAAKLSLKDLQKEASRLQNVTLYGDEAILDSMAQILTFTDIKGDVFKRTQAMVLDLSTTLNTDLKSSAILLGKALNDPAKGMSMMTRVGIKFTDKQIDVIKAMQATGDIAGAQNSILKILEGQYGGTAKAAAKAGTGPLTQLWNILGDINEVIGKEIMEIIRPFIAKIKEMAIGFQNLSPQVKKIIAIFAIVMTVVGPIIIGLGALIAIFPFVAAGFALISLPVLAVAAGIAALIALVVSLIAYWDDLVKIFDKVMDYDFSNILGDIKGFLGFGDAVAEINANTKSESKVDVNLNAPEGIVKSIKSRSGNGTQLNVGTNMLATAQ